ncbi:unnamed protein product [Darwinula stevensoni]|uniref:TLC domain-containing protein n=1 Tax=Darwinula stevensoni TaxID=69355 RepID=A0A7R8XAV9_9CRUS|nr:unnamed protein product [Darwinula stevensoni]CAG0885870.1 unnamed protein product [Darwinula stevensoni]
MENASENAAKRFPRRWPVEVDRVSVGSVVAQGGVAVRDTMETTAFGSNSTADDSGERGGLANPRPAVLALPLALGTYQLTHFAMKRWLEPLGWKVMSPLIPPEQKRDCAAKFAERAWELIVYVILFVWDAVVLWDKPWMWDVTLTWDGFPHHPVERDVWWLYMAHVVASVWFLVAVLVHTGKRKWPLFFHHCIVLVAVYIGWFANGCRFACLMFALYEVSDVFLVAALSFHELGRKFCRNIIFALTLTVFVPSRVLVIPIITVRGLLSVKVITGVMYAISFFLFVLTGLSIYWARGMYSVLKRSKLPSLPCFTDLLNFILQPMEPKLRKQLKILLKRT